MAGLLDSLGYGNQGGYGGLLDMLMHQSPLLQPQQPVAGPQYDPMGMPFAAAPQADANVFGPLPQMSQPTPAMYAPQSAFNSGGSAPLPGLQPGIPVGQNGAPAPQPPPVENQAGNINVDGYSMPRVGNMAEYTPQTPTDVSAQSRQPQPVPQALPPALGGDEKNMGFFDRLNRGLQSIGNGGSIIGSLTGNRTDAQSMGQKNLGAQFQELQRVLIAHGEKPDIAASKAMLAVLNPKAAETLFPQAFEKKQFGFMKTDGDQIVATNPLDGTAKVAFGSNDSNKDGIAGPDGKIIPYPAGADAAARKIFANEIARINADAAGGKKTEVQAKSEKFGNTMELSEKQIKSLEGQGTSLFGKIASGLPLGNYAQSPEFQNYTQAKNKFITSLLRDQSGAAIGTSEFIRYEKELFPQPGDSPGVIKQKSEARRIEIEGMKKAAGPGYKGPTEGQSTVRKYNPVTGTIE